MVAPQQTPAGQALEPAGRGPLFAAILTAMLLAMGAVLVLLAGPFNWAFAARAVRNFFGIFANPWHFPTEAAWGLVCGSIVAADVCGVGYLLLARVRPWRRMLPMALERAALAPLAGAIPLSLAVLGLGLAGLVGRGIFSALLLLLTPLAALGWRAAAGDFRTGARRARGGLMRSIPRPALIFLLTLLSLLAILTLLYTLSPSVESDELRYHLAAPASWLRDGRIHYLPNQSFSNFPMLSEMLFMLALALGGDEAAKLIHLAFLPVCMALIGLLARRLLGARGAGASRSLHLLVAAAAFAFIPTVPILAAWGFIDMIMTAYFLAFVYLAGRALLRPGRGSGTLIGAVVAGAASVKYSLVPLVGGLGIAWTGLLLLTPAGRRNTRRILLSTVLFAILFSVPWYLRNLAWTGNPFYFLGNSIFHGGEWTAECQTLYMGHVHQKGFHLTSIPGPLGKLVEFLITPLTTALFFDKFEDHYLGAVPLLALLLTLGWLLAARWSRQPAQPSRPLNMRLFGGWIALATVVSWVFWFQTYQSSRLLLPTLGLLLAAGGWAGARWDRHGFFWSRLTVRILLGLAFLYAFIFYFSIVFGGNLPRGRRKGDAVATALGFEERSFYLGQKLNYWKGAQWLARRARPGEKALLIGEHRTMHFALPIVASDWFDTPQPLPWIQKTPDNEALLDELLKNGVRYIFLNAGELRLYYRSDFCPRFSPEELLRYEALWVNPRLRPIFREKDGDVYIFMILPKGERR